MSEIQKKLKDWAEKYVPQFNDLSQQVNTIFYTQSPLSCVDSEIDTLIIGINPKGNKDGFSNLTPEKYLNGNEHWNERFSNGKISKDWAKFVGGARFFLGYDNNRHNETIDNDAKTIWTNISPFQSNNGFSDLPKEVVAISFVSTLELISILKPKRIILLGANNFSMIDKYAPSGIKERIEHVKVLESWNLHIGRIDNIPTVCVTHPSGHWAIGNTFIPAFILTYFLTDRYDNGKPANKLEEVCEKMRDEFYRWQTKLNIQK